MGNNKFFSYKSVLLEQFSIWAPECLREISLKKWTQYVYEIVIVVNQGREAFAL